jgi:hypothetical protein
VRRSQKEYVLEMVVTYDRDHYDPATMDWSSGMFPNESNTRHDVVVLDEPVELGGYDTAIYQVTLGIHVVYRNHNDLEGYNWRIVKSDMWDGEHDFELEPRKITRIEEDE